MKGIIEVMKEIEGKESAIELDLENLNLGTRHVKIGLEGKARLKLIHLRDGKPAKSK